jgi:hypothetical protein
MDFLKSAVAVAALSFSAVALAAPSSTIRPHNAASALVHTNLQGATVLLLEDVEPWGSNANETILASLGVAYDVATSADMPTLKVGKYSTIIVASDQPQPFYDALTAFLPKIDKWLLAGAHTFELHAADNGWEGGFLSVTLPKGVSINQAFDYTNYVVLPNSPLVAGAPATIAGSYASHVNFNPGQLNSFNTVITDTTGAPVLLDYCINKKSRIIASGETLEIAYNDGWDATPVLVDMLTASTTTPGCHH